MSKVFFRVDNNNVLLGSLFRPVAEFISVSAGEAADRGWLWGKESTGSVGG